MLQIQGKELSYNNINDVDAAFDLVSEFDNGTFACAIVKHANPCGDALGESQNEAYKKAFTTKPDFSEAYNNLGTALEGKGKLEEAVEAYTKAILLKPDYAAVSYTHLTLPTKA